MDFFENTFIIANNGVIVGGQPLENIDEVSDEISVSDDISATQEVPLNIGEEQMQQVQAGGIFGSGMTFWVVVIVIYVAAMYIFAIRPQKRKTKQMHEIQNSLVVGDAVITTTGFYGKIVDIEEEVFIVEFGTNKGVRIPVKKSEVLKAKDASIAEKQ